MEKIKRWNRYHAFALSASLWGVLSGWQLQISVSIAALSFAYFLALHVDWMRQQRPFGGYAFWLTFFRLLLILGLAWQFAALSDLQIFGVAFLAMLADGVDGWLARKFQTASDFGAYFDMESDAFFVCTLGSILYLKNYFGPWILGIAFLRYLYVVLVMLLQQDRKQEGENRYATPIAGFLFLSLLTPFIMASSWYEPIVVVASALVSASFAYGFWTLIRPTNLSE